MIQLKHWWGLACAFGAGIPFAVLEIIEITGVQFPEVPGGDIWMRAMIGFFSGFLSGLFQAGFLKLFTSRVNLWIFGSTIAWTLCGLSTTLVLPSLLGVFVGGFLLAVITGFSIHRILKV